MLLATVLIVMSSMLQRISGLLMGPLFLMGLLFEGNPFLVKTWSAHPQMAFLCFGLPLTLLSVAQFTRLIIQWLAQDGPFNVREQSSL